MKQRLEEISEFINSRMDSYPGTRKKLEAEGKIYYYDLEPGDRTRYQFMLSPMSDDMCKIQSVPSGSYMVTFIMGDWMRSFPVDLHSIWDPGYLRSKLDLRDQYTHKALHVLLTYIADDILTDKEFGLGDSKR